MLKLTEDSVVFSANNKNYSFTLANI